MILDTNVWIRFVVGFDLHQATFDHIENIQASGERLAVSAFTLWEVAKLVERSRIDLSMSLDTFFDLGLMGSNVEVVPLSRRVASLSCQLPPGMNNDPADQVIIATAMIHREVLATLDRDLVRYPHCRTYAARKA